MKKLTGLDFARGRWRLTGVAVALSIGAAFSMVSLYERVRDAAWLREGIEEVGNRVEQRRQANDRETLRKRRMSPEERRIEQTIAKQLIASAGSGMTVVDAIESAWSPEIALTSVNVTQAGYHARLEGGAAKLSHIYQFLERLHEQRPDCRVRLTQHFPKSEDGHHIHRFSLTVEQS